MGQNTKAICNAVTRFVFSHVGLLIIVSLYCVGGGFIFEYLEKENEKEICFDTKKEYDSMEQDVMEKIYKVAGSAENISLVAFQVQEILQVFRDNSVKIDYSGINCTAYGQPDGPKFEWSWAGAFFFCVTVISTIGYGHIAPKTVWGRVVCIAYATLGIPIFLVCLAMVGDALSDIYRYIYTNLCCLGWCKRQKKQSQKAIINKEKIKIARKAWSGNPDENIGNSINVYPRKMEGEPKFEGSKPRLQPLDVQILRNRSNPEKISYKEDRKPFISETSDDDEYGDGDDEMGHEHISIPVTYVMMVMGSYLIAGSFLFGFWEAWDIMQSFYFCFITLSTIGFGDVTPGTDFDSPEASAKLVLGAIYMLLGMSLVSMCFALMQEDIIEKAKWIGRKLKIVEADDDE